MRCLCPTIFSWAELGTAKMVTAGATHIELHTMVLQKLDYIFVSTERHADKVAVLFFLTLSTAYSYI